jgi:hypothetical protein
MGWPSFLEDIEKRLDEAMRLYSPPRGGSRENVSVESLKETNDILRQKNDDLLRAIYVIKADISSKKQTDFCKDECVRLKTANFKLVISLKKLEEVLPDLGFTKETPAPHKARNTPPVPKRLSEAKPPIPQHLSEAKLRFHETQKAVESAKQVLKKAEKVRTEAQNEYQALLQSERNRTKHVHDTGHK